MKVLSGRSLGGGGTIILTLYCAPFHSKVGYGSFVYVSTTKPELSVIDSVCNTGIYPAIGTFDTIIWRICMYIQSE
jgi:hypothetical protein